MFGNTEALLTSLFFFVWICPLLSFAHKTGQNVIFVRWSLTSSCNYSKIASSSTIFDCRTTKSRPSSFAVNTAIVEESAVLTLCVSYSSSLLTFPFSPALFSRFLCLLCVCQYLFVLSLPLAVSDQLSLCPLSDSMFVVSMYVLTSLQQLFFCLCRLVFSTLYSFCLFPALCRFLYLVLSIFFL